MHQAIIKINTEKKSLIDITDQVQDQVKKLALSQGLCNVFVQHTSCSIIISENADPDVLRDLESYMGRIVPEDFNYRHGAEGKDDMPAHIRSVLTQNSISIPVVDERLMLGTWQALYLWEHRGHSFHRKLVLTIL